MLKGEEYMMRKDSNFAENRREYDINPLKNNICHVQIVAL